MDKNIIYRETQTLGPWWVWLLVIVVSAALLVLAIMRLRKVSMKDRPGAFGWYILLAMTMVGNVFGGAFLMVFRMETRIDDVRIETLLFPIELTYRHVDWDDVDSFYVRTYSPLTEYGGWGLRGLGTQNVALNFWGDEGLQLHLKSGKRVLIGTQEPERLDAALATGLFYPFSGN